MIRRSSFKFASRAIIVGLIMSFFTGGMAGGAEPVSMGQLVGVKGLVVPPVEKDDVSKLVDAGTIDTDGYSYIVLNLAGEMKERPLRQGNIGVLLVPDVPPFDLALTHLNLLPVPLETKAAVTLEPSPYFMAKQVRFEVGFPKYRVLLYNTTGGTATVAVFAYRTK